MALTGKFTDFMHRIRDGDATAAAELVRRYEMAVRVAVRVRLTDPRLRRHFDSMDVCQSVMASFFVRAAAGQFDLDRPEQLVGLLVAMARNKLLMQVRRHQQQIRDVRRDEVETATPLIDPAPGPVRQAVGRDLLVQFLARLPEAERELAQWRAAGQTWDEIAGRHGGTPQGHRMRLSRAVDRLATEMGIDDGSLEDTGS